MSENINRNDNDIDYSEWPEEYVKGHPGFIYGSLALAYYLREIRDAGYSHPGEVGNLWLNLLGPPRHPNTGVQRQKLATPFSENHHALIVSVLKKKEAKGDTDTKVNNNNNNNNNNNGDGEDGKDDDGERSALNDAYLKPMLVVKPQRAMRPTTSAEEAQRVWDLAFERRFKDTMMANRTKVLRNSLYCALSVGLKVMFYYFDASKGDDDETLFTRLHGRPLDLEVVADQVEVERWLKHINKHIEEERDF